MGSESRRFFLAFWLRDDRRFHRHCAASPDEVSQEPREVIYHAVSG
jgi:hypothetical protein